VRRRGELFAPGKFFAVCLLACVLLFSNQTASANYPARENLQTILADKFLRTELYFGTNVPGGGRVSDEDWNKFLESFVTPRFPDGFTVLEGYGQYKDSAGEIVREESRVLVLFYPKKTCAEVNTKIEEIRAEYKKQFNQESVLRLDFMKAVNVKF
jgi:hypothetical protein